MRSRNSGRRNQSNRPQNFESSGPDIKVRGSAQQVVEKYLQLARDATMAGNPIMAENYYQHAEHYFRVQNANGANGRNQAGRRAQSPNGAGNGADGDIGEDDAVEFSEQPDVEVEGDPETASSAGDADAAENPVQEAG